MNLAGVVAGFASTHAVFATRGFEPATGTPLGQLVERPGEVVRAGQPARIKIQVRRAAFAALYPPKQ